MKRDFPRPITRTAAALPYLGGENIALLALMPLHNSYRKAISMAAIRVEKMFLEKRLALTEAPADN